MGCKSIGSMKWALTLTPGIYEPVCPNRPGLGFRATESGAVHRDSESRSLDGQPCWGVSSGSQSEGASSGVQSQSRRSKRPPHARQTMNSSWNVSYGPQSSPCVSTEVTNRKSPADEPQSGQAIYVSPLASMPCSRRPVARAAAMSRSPLPLFGANPNVALDWGSDETDKPSLSAVWIQARSRQSF